MNFVSCFLDCGSFNVELQRYKVNSDFALTVSSAELSDAGLYVCTTTGHVTSDVTSAVTSASYYVTVYGQLRAEIPRDNHFSSVKGANQSLKSFVGLIQNNIQKIQNHKIHSCHILIFRTKHDSLL